MSSDLYSVPQNGSKDIIIENGKLYRVSIESCWYSAYSKLGTYLIYGLNVADSKTNGKPEILTLSESSSIDWSFDFSRVGDYNSNMTINSSGWGDQGLKIVVEKIYDDTHVNIKDQILTSKNYMLSQNYPNPFNPTTNIQFSIPEANHVSLNIYDLLGKEVAMLVNERKSAGSYTYEFDGSNLSSGIYIYKLQAGNFTATKKLILMK